MRGYALTLGLVCSCATVPLSRSSEPEVRSLIERQVAAWNRGDLEGFCAGYSENAVFVSPSGITHGRAEVLARYQKKYGGQPETMGQLALEPLDVRPSSDQVSVVAKWTLTWSDHQATGSTLVVFQRNGTGWSIVHDASM